MHPTLTFLGAAGTVTGLNSGNVGWCFPVTSGAITTP